MSNFVAALDTFKPKQIGENGNVEYGKSHLPKQKRKHSRKNTSLDRDVHENNKGIKKKFSDIMNKNLSDYQKGACPVAEELHAKTYFSIPICYYEYTIKDILRIIKSFRKVWKMSRWI